MLIMREIINMILEAVINVMVQEREERLNIREEYVNL